MKDTKEKQRKSSRQDKTFTNSVTETRLSVWLILSGFENFSLIIHNSKKNLIFYLHGSHRLFTKRR